MADEQFCDICKIKLTDNDYSYRCSTCMQIIKTNKKKTNFNSTSVQKALIDSAFVNSDGERVYRCYYTGLPCDVKARGKYDSSSLSNAFDLTFDHLDPRYTVGSDGLVVCLNVVNQMKSNIPDKIFKDIIIILGKHFEKNDPYTLEREFGTNFVDLIYSYFDVFDE